MSARYLVPSLVVGGFLVFACGSSDGAGAGGFSGGGGGALCTFDPSCGTPCTGDKDCPTRLHCEAGMCNAECAQAGDACPGGGTCDKSGRCVGGPTSASTFVGSGAGNPGGTGGRNGSGGAAPGAGGSGGSCGDVTVAFAPQTPTVVLLIDQSGSMTTTFANGLDRWDSVYQAVMDPAAGPVKALQPAVRFGLALYSGEDGTCPDVTTVMPPVLNNYDPMNAVWQPAMPKNNTPTGESIQQITPVIAAITDPGPKLILLATDGDPDTCAAPDSNGTQPPKDAALAAVTAAFNLGIKTVILAVGDQVSTTHQQDMANAGSGLPYPAPDPCDQVNDPTHCAPTYTPSSQQALIDAFNSIIQGQRTCTFVLNGSVISGKECQGVVKVDGMTIPCNDPNGWKLDDPSTIEFTGTACAQILAEQSVMITASFPCDAALTGSGGSTGVGPH